MEQQGGEGVDDLFVGERWALVGGEESVAQEQEHGTDGGGHQGGVAGQGVAAGLQGVEVVAQGRSRRSGAARRGRSRAGPSPAVLAGRIALAQAAVLSLPVAGLSLLLGVGGGLYLLAPGIILGVVVAVLDGWVLLIEILR